MRLAAVLLVVGCGRVGFEPLAGTDATRDGIAGVGCLQIPPFLHLISPREEGSSGGDVPVFWCASGVAGPLTASMIEPDGTTVRASATGPIDTGTIYFNIGSVVCDPCFIRLEAGGFTVDGPPAFHSGD